MITISKYFPGFAMPDSDSEYCRTKFATPEEAIRSECWQERVGDKKLQYADYEKVGTEMVFFDGKWGSIVVKADTVEEMQALIDLAGIKPGKAGERCHIFDEPYCEVIVPKDHSHYHLFIDLPGVAPSDLMLRVAQNSLEVSGVRRLHSEALAAGKKNKRIKALVARSTVPAYLLNHFKFAFPLPFDEAVIAQVETHLEHGVLQVTFGLSEPLKLEPLKQEDESKQVVKNVDELRKNVDELRVTLGELQTTIAWGIMIILLLILIAR